MMPSYDSRGVIVSPENVDLWLEHDPLSIGEYRRYDFTLELFHVVETESTIFVRKEDKTLKIGGTYTDFYGFGTSSRRDVIAEAERYLEDYGGSPIDVIVETHVIRQAAFQKTGQKEPFYSHAVNLFYVPHSWRPATLDKENWHEHEGWKQTTVLEIWKNGQPGKDAEALDTRLRTLIDLDVGDAYGRQKGLYHCFM